MSLKPGDTLLNQRYRIVRLLGKGGFGFVYLAEDALLRDQVAIKELIPALVGDEATLKRFMAEARATLRLRHKRIVATHNVFSEGENYYIVMEYLPGGSLEDRLRARGALGIDEAVRVAVEVCEGLACAHEQGVVHCDLKPHNILFDAHGSAKVADFGIAHVPGEMLTRSWMTPAGFVAGTLPYMSPEQADGVRDDPRIDVYAVGAVLYRMLVGRPYLGFDQRETPGAQADNVYRIRHEAPVAPSLHNSGIPAWLDATVLKALAKDLHYRFHSVDALRVTLQHAQMPAPSPAPTPPPMSTPIPPPGGTHTLPPRQGIYPPAQAPVAGRGRQAERPQAFWGLLGAVGALGVILVIAIVALFAGRGDGTPTPVAVVTETHTLAPTPGGGSPTAPAVVPPEVSHTATAQPTDTPTNVPVPPTSSPLSTDTATPVSTDTPLAPTDTPSPLPTDTPIPRTDTPIPLPTDTPAPPTRTPTPRPPVAGDTQPRQVDGTTMVFVPAGDFRMGSSDADIDAILAACAGCQRAWYADEQPQHVVYLDAFWVDRTEVTNAQFRKCVDAGVCQAPTACDGGSPTYNDGSKSNHPAVCVSWHQARAYCEWVGGRLPTEAEWEKAARETDGRKYPWGGGAGDCGRMQSSNCGGQTVAVGSKPAGASPYGALDLAGNVWEWVRDWYGANYYAASPARNPTGPASGDSRVLRGGSWSNSPDDARSALRIIHNPGHRSDEFGFRCVVPWAGR